jgi:hypothetical protein
MFYAIERKDGGVEIMQCFHGASVADEIAKWHPERQAEVIAASVKPIDPSSIPADRTFRGAWKPDLTHDMEKCRAIHRDKLRSLRGPLLASLDVDYQRADEAGDQSGKAEVARRKQFLRDITKHPAIDAAQTPGDLKKVSI